MSKIFPPIVLHVFIKSSFHLRWEIINTHKHLLAMRNQCLRHPYDAESLGKIEFKLFV